jgi:hypothetical protein
MPKEWGCLPYSAGSLPLQEEQEAMTTNQTIDGVPRELLLRVLDPYRPRGQEKARKELRALLDAPAAPFILDGWSVDHSAGRPILMHNNCSVIEAEQAYGLLSLIRAAAQPQGEPVAWLNVATGHVTTSAVVVMDWDDEKEQVQSLYAEQPAPVAVSLLSVRRYDRDSVSGHSDVEVALPEMTHYDHGPNLAEALARLAGRVARFHKLDAPTLATQPAPVAVVLPERKEIDKYGEFYDSGWNDCLDDLKRLNPSL